MADILETDSSLPDVKTKDVEAAQKEGILEAVKDGAKQQFLSTDGVENNDPEPGIIPTYDVFHLQDLVDLDPDALKDRLNSKTEFGLTDGQIAGLLEVERSGKNRTDIVKVLCDRLKIDTPYAVTDAGPNYTNDVNRSVVKPRG